MVSAGLFAGLGDSFSVSYTNASLTSGTGKGGYAEMSLDVVTRACEFSSETTTPAALSPQAERH